MIDVIGDLYQYLSAQTDITDILDVYAGAPAIFAEQVPADHEITQPVVVLDYPTVSQRLQTSSNINRDIQITIRLYAQVYFTRAGASFHDTLLLQQASECIAKALVTARIPVSGGILRGANIQGPIISPTEDTSLAGRLITVRWQVEES